MSESSVQSSPLDVIAMPLRGRHLIEASAGTGKTFNITRIYLRLLLEKSYTVQQILVMTFTKAATEEIKGRIAETLREAVDLWRHAASQSSLPDSADPVFHALYAVAQGELGLAKLEAALLELDEAAVFTIHGFCNHVLSQLAFASGSPMSLTLETDTQALWEEAAADWIRIMALQPQQYALLAEAGWHVPGQFIAEFNQAIKSELEPEYCDDEAVLRQYEKGLNNLKVRFQHTFHDLYSELKIHEALISEKLILSKKGSERDERAAEWEVLLNWLEAKGISAPDKAAKEFVKGTRYARQKEVKAVLEPVKDFINTLEKELAQLDAAKQKNEQQQPLYKLVCEGFAWVRQHVANAKRRLGIVDFDDLIRLLAQKVRGGDDTLKKALRALYPVALIDEFQDTDDSQYSILSAVYPSGSDDLTLMMIGDPKQAIYGFRGGDIFTYLEAGRQADYRWVMDTNWRSVAPMVDAYNRLFYGAPVEAQARDVFGYGIRYEPVKSTEHAKAAKHPLSDPAERAALNYVVLEAEEDTPANANTLSLQLANWMSHEIQRLLSEAMMGETPLQPADIAILVRSGPEADLVKKALRQVGLGSVYLSTSTSLFASAEAADLYRVLDGIWHSEQIRRLSAALASPLMGYPHEELVAMLHDEDDDLWEDCMAEVGTLRQIWLKQGCMAVVLNLLRRRFRVTGRDTERQLTNYMHLAEVLEQQASATLQPEQLLQWLHRQVHDPQYGEEQIQRLESDARLIQIITQHGSKGLEYPVVFVPFASRYRDPVKQGTRDLTIYKYYNSETGKQTLQLGATEEVAAQVRDEGEAEAMRLLYVAITRAAHRCYLGVAPYKNNERSALGKAADVQAGESWYLPVNKVEQENGGHTRYLQAAELPAEPHSGHTVSAQASETPLALSQFKRSVEDAWRLYSFTALTRQQIAVKQTARDEETDLAVPGNEPVAGELPIRFTLEKGATAGNLLHDLLEVTDFTAPDWQSHRSMANRLSLSDDDFSALSCWMDEVLATPLCAPGLRVPLNSLSLPVTLREAEFYFPVEKANWWSISRILTAHRSAVNGDNALAVPKLSRPMLEGMMHGFIDLIFEHDGRFYVADYKSTHLGDTFTGYSFNALAHNNQHHLYDLQYLLYALALHRFLTVSKPDYDIHCHLGGVFYLYVRGMHPDNRGSEGVFYTPLAAELVLALDAAFKGETGEVAL